MKLERPARAFVVALALGIGVAYVVIRAGEFAPADAAAYWDAALRLRAGESPYLLVSSPDAAEVFRYAPWFAAAWIPLTFLPRDLVFAAWWVAMLGVAAVVCWRVGRLGPAGIAIVGLIGPYLIWIAGRGNVHPLIVLGLLVSAQGKAGPWIVGAAASLKATPLAFALVYLGRGEYRRFIVAVVVFLLLTLPIALFGTAGYEVDPGLDPNPLFAISPILWLLVVGSLCLATLYVARRWPEHAWWVASLAATAAILRFLPYALTYLLVGLAPALSSVSGVRWRLPGRLRSSPQEREAGEEDREAVGP
jgi:hypothetical protein